MSIEENAAQIDPLNAFVQGNDDHTTQQSEQDNQKTESATVDTPDSTEAEKPTEDGFQKRINKVTKAKHEEIRKREASDKRADDLQKQLDEMNKKASLKEPTLEAHDYDEEAFNQAQVSYQVQEQVKAQLESQSKGREVDKQKAAAQQVADSFNERVTALGKDDFDTKVGLIPDLPAGVADAIMQEENGAELAYHLGNHLDIADKLASMTPAAAMVELGRISLRMATKPEIKTSAAPDPITPVSSGSALSSDVNDEMSMSDWMAKFG